MLWTAVAALMLTVFKAGGNSNELSTSMQVDSIPTTLIYSVCLSGLILGIYWKRQGHFFFDEPGQVAFVIHGMVAGYMLVSASISSYFGFDLKTEDRAHWPAMFVAIGWLPIGIVQLILYFKFASKFEKDGKWGRFFYAVGVITLLQYISMFLAVISTFIFVVWSRGSVELSGYLYMAMPFFAGIAELAYWMLTVRYDFRESTSYHWTHWLGTVTWPALTLASFATWILAILFGSNNIY